MRLTYKLIIFIIKSVLLLLSVLLIPSSVKLLKEKIYRATTFRRPACARDNYSLTEDNLTCVIKRATTRRKALCSRLFHLGRDSLSKLRKSITIFLTRVWHRTIYGASRLQRTHNPHPICFSLSLSLLRCPLISHRDTSVG